MLRLVRPGSFPGGVSHYLSWRSLMVPVFLAASLILIGSYNFLLFHTLAELYAIMIGLLLAVVVWNTYDLSRNNFLMYLGCGYFWVAALDLLHALAYKGMYILPVSEANTSTQLWIATRYVESMLLLSAPLFLSLKLERIRVMAIFAALSMLIVALIFSANFPDAFIEGQGLTRFKIFSEYVIILLLTGAIIHLYYRRSLVEPRVFRLMVLSIVLSIGAELAFTFYVSVYGLSNMVGHIFKILSYWLIYQAVIQTTLKEPFRVMARGAGTYNAIPDPAIVVDKAGIISQVNQAAVRMSGRSESELLGQHCHELFHPPASTRADCLLCKHIREALPLDTTELKYPETDHWCRFTLSAIGSPDGISGMVQVCSDISEKKQAEETLASSLERYRALIESTQDFVWEVDRNGVYTYCSPQTKQILGYEPQELLGKTPFDLMLPQEVERIRQEFRQKVASQQPFSFLENINRHKGGREVILETNGTPFFNADGELIGYRGIDRDITARKQLESYQRESEKRFRELIDRLPNVAVQGFDRRHRVIYWNEASARLYGYSAQEALGRSLEQLIVPEARRKAVIAGIDDWIEKGKEIPPGEIELRHKNGSQVPVYSSHVMLKMDTHEPEMFSVDVDLTEQKNAQSELSQLATIDQLTGLPNRRFLDVELRNRVQEASRFNYRLAVLFIDLDNFKNINDSLGHEYGDMLLTRVAERIQTRLRVYDILSRFGGDEFVLVVPRFEHDDEIASIAEKIMQDFSMPFALNGSKIYSTFSMGISLFPDDASNASDLLKYADVAMYRAKEQGRNGYQFFTQLMNERLQHERKIESQLRDALNNQEFRLVYQPQIDLSNGEIIGCEALIRWFPDEEESISPAEFIPIAEKTTLINEIGLWVIDEACRQKAQWKQSGVRDIRIDINLSGRQFFFHEVFDQLHSALQRHGLAYSDIGVELTEYTLIESYRATISELQKLQSRGIHIAIDDFGTGYSSLSYLKHLPVSSLKIDQEFVRDAPNDSSDRTIIEAILAMGHSMGLSVLAEGVETEQQYRLVKEIQCDYAQGYFFHRPMPAEQLAALLSPQESG